MEAQEKNNEVLNAMFDKMKTEFDAKFEDITKNKFQRWKRR